MFSDDTAEGRTLEFLDAETRTESRTTCGDDTAAESKINIGKPSLFAKFPSNAYVLNLVHTCGRGEVAKLIQRYPIIQCILVSYLPHTLA
jgi:hypothetical protein